MFFFWLVLGQLPNAGITRRVQQRHFRGRNDESRAARILEWHVSQLKWPTVNKEEFCFRLQVSQAAVP